MDQQQTELDFKGASYEPARDQPRLSTQHRKVRSAALGWPGGWFTMQELAARIDEPAGSVERQVRYLRSNRFGGWTVEKRRRSYRDGLKGGTFEYRVVA